MTIWSVLLAAVAVVVLVVIPVWGAVKFKPHRARNVKYAEANAEATIEHHVAEVSSYHPDYTRGVRIDRHPYYLAPHVAVFGYALCVFAGAPLTSNVAVLGQSTRTTMATCFLIGSGFVLAGSMLGGKLFGRWIVMRKVRDHLTASILGDDITMPYWMSAAGLLMVSVSMGLYSTTSFKSTTGSLGGWLTATLAAGAAFMLPMLYLRIRKFTLEDRTLIAEAVARLECSSRANR